MTKRGNQDEYNKLLDAFNAKTKSKNESVLHLMRLGFSYEQAKNAVHVYWKGGETKATFILSRDERDKWLNDFDATRKTPNECVNYLRGLGCTYNQAKSAVYKYRQERGLIRKQNV